MDRTERVRIVRESLGMIADLLAEVIVDAHTERFGDSSFDRTKASPGQVAEYIGVTAQTIRNQVKAGMPATQTESGRWVIDLDAWEEMLGPLAGAGASRFQRGVHDGHR